MVKDLKKFYQLLRPYRGKVWLAIILGALSGGATGAGLTNGVENLFTQVFDHSKQMTTGQIVAIASGFPALFILIGLSNFGSAYFINFAGLAAIRDLRTRIFGHLQNLPLAYFQHSRTGDLISRITGDAQMLQQTLNYIARHVIMQPAAFLGAAYYLVSVAYKNEGVVDIYVCLFVLPFVVFPIRHFSRKLERKARSQQEEFGSLTSNLAQNLGAAREIRAFNLQARENRSFQERVRDLFNVQMKVVKYTFALPPAVEIVSSIGLSIAFVLSYKKGIDGGVFTAIFLAIYVTYTAVKKLGAFVGELAKGMAALDRIQEILDQPATILDRAAPASLNRVEGKIEFRDVSFSYGDAIALNSVSTVIEKGTVCALVGPSGAGKTTFANLVPRFYDVSAGSVHIDGVDIRDISQQELRANIAIVSQEPVLFNESILENIRLGRLDATDEEVKVAAANAFADEFILEQENGYDTLVGERGTRLSGGQKQRIAIARAFLRNAPILILDEATSALDSESEKKVQSALERLVVGKTVLIIAHRFSTIKDATRILVFKDGQLVDQGDHAELYENNALYRSLYDQQR